MGAQPRRRDDPELRDRVRQLHAGGHSRNAIARQVGASQSTVSLIAQDLGLTFDRDRTAEATEAARADHAARRRAIIAGLYDQAEAQLARLNLDEHELSQPSAGQLITWTAKHLPAQDVKALIQSIGTATDKAVRLEQVDASDGADDVASMLGRIGDALLGAADRLDTPPDATADDEVQ
ncbi:helix-turn-helix domain-containing protein [Streptomonospora sp. PA3]|uniref:helix-turn-helix domain-containing protein n=1 Tax=Streptomonospora sp. PA3 TaxID=2607326 RepID=UPI0012DCE38A|nr:helix-turn-helix domain-containing protein [Streptomonospora sp. PA3]MUL39617.1 helix-turn-helix domain-containing protein [Streptomonospora sp. PA3]